jgi:hypothetical protein
MLALVGNHYAVEGSAVRALQSYQAHLLNERRMVLEELLDLLRENILSGTENNDLFGAPGNP